MPTKKELTEELEALKRSNAALKGQITKLENSASDELRARVNDLLSNLEARGLNKQAGEKEVRLIREAMD